MALQAGVIDVPLSPPNQVTSPTMGPLGVLEHLVDGQVTRYEPQYGGATGVTPAKIEVSQRDAFQSLPATARSVVDGSPSSPPWTPVEALNSIGPQLVSICDAQPRVYNGVDWRTYPGVRVLTNQLSQDVFHTSNTTKQAPDSAWLAGVTCAVWTETVVSSTGPVTSVYAGFRADNGAWVVTPTVLGTSGGIANRQVMAKVVSDGFRFWVVFNDGNATPGLIIYTFDTHGAFLAGTATTLPTGSGYPGFWDITAAATAGGYTMKLAVPVAVGQGVDSGVVFHGYGWNGTGIIHTSATDGTVHCSGPMSWLTNDLGNGLAYLATGRKFSDAEEDIWAYEVTNLAQTHEYSTGLTFDEDVTTLDTITGYTVAATGVTVVLSIGLLPADVTPPASGPPVDPAFRFLKTIQVTRAAVATVLRTTQSVCQVSRAFAIDGEYYVFAYYQSGSGIGLLPKTASVTITDGDYMIGAAVQPLAIVAGDEVSGSPIAATNVTPSTGNTVNVCPPAGTSLATFSIVAGDTVSRVTATLQAPYGIPDGTPLLAWNLTHIPPGGAQLAGARLVLSGASANNSTFDIVQGSGSTVYTPTFDIFGNPFTSSITFTTAGTGQLQAMTAYYVSDLSAFIPSNDVASFFTSGGHAAVTLASTGGNNGTFLIERISTPVSSWPNTAGNPTYDFGLRSGSYVWTSFVSGQTTHNDTFSISIAPNNPNHWFFANGKFDSTYIGADLVVSANPALPSNAGTFPITAVDAINTVTTGAATALISQIFTFPFPTVSINLTTQVAYTFKLQSLGVPDYTFQNALVSVQGADSVNNGVYQIVQINADGTFIAQPQNGLTNQVNEAFFAAGPVTITIFFAQNIQPEFQPTWFIVPLTGSQPVVGRFEYGLAYADWRIEIDSTFGPNLFPMSVASPALTPEGWEIVLPYRAQNVTAATLETTPAGEVNIVAESFVSTVGLKVFTLANTTGKPEPSNGELSIPGPMAVVFTPSGFLEDGQNLAPEAPFLVSQSVGTSGQLALTLAGIYFVVAVLEFSDENGNRTYSPPSPALQVNMSLTNNVATYGGRLPYPISPSGVVPAGVFGPTTRLSGISLYRSAFLNGEPTTQHYKITNDLNVNGLAPATTINASGFSFPDTFTWNYVDQNPDAGLNANEILYTDKSLLPRYPQPAGPNGPKTWKNREWVIGYDDAIWMSGEKTEGDAIWYNPAFRFPFPAEDAPVGLSGMDDYLIVTCEASVWYIPAAQFPDATGGNGGLPTPVRLPFPNGSRNGFAETIREGVAYDSTDGGVWLVTRQLENKWLSHPLQTTIGDGPILGMAVDQAQRLFVMLFIVEPADPSICVYDGIPQCWYEWVTPSTPKLLASFNGQACYQDAALVVPVVPGAVVDILAGVSTGIAGPDVSTQEMNFGNTRGLKKVWEFQGVGTYKGPHNSNAVLSYPEDGWPTSNYVITPTSLNPYILALNPNPEDASTYKIRIFPDFSGIGSPGATFALEMISAQVGVEPIGLNKLPSYLVMKGK